MRYLIICTVVALTGCQSGKDPLHAAYWAETRDGWPAFCVPADDDVRCFTPALEDREHFDGICGAGTSGI